LVNGLEAAESRALLQTLTIGVAALVVLAVARWHHERSLRHVGLATIAALAGKVLILDVVALSGGYVVGSFLTLGAATLGASLLTRKTPPPVDPEDPPEDQEEAA